MFVTTSYRAILTFEGREAEEEEEVMRHLKMLFPILLAAGCAGTMRDCSSWWAGASGADWLVAQYKYDGTPLRCWRLPNTSIANEPHSDGVYWKSPDGHLVHLSGWYNRVQVANGDFDGAARELGITGCALEKP